MDVEKIWAKIEVNSGGFILVQHLFRIPGRTQKMGNAIYKRMTIAEFDELRKRIIPPLDKELANAHDQYDEVYERIGKKAEQLVDDLLKRNILTNHNKK